MPYIEDKDVFKAVSFASSMIKKGTSPALAIHKSCTYYKVNEKDVASNLGKRGASVSNAKNNS